MKYSTRLLLLLMFSWGMIGLERMVMAFVMPAIQQDFKLSYTEVGALISAFGFAWALGTWSMGSLSDYIGRRLVIVVLMIFGGVCSWLTGIAGTFVMLLTIRAIMGFAEGGIAGPASAALAEESPPQHRGRNLGLMTGSFVFLGGAVGPVLSTKLMASFGWRPVFFIYAIPAIFLGILLFLFMREPASVQATIKARKEGKAHRKRLEVGGPEITYMDVFKNRNVILMIFIWTAQMVWMWLFTTFGVMFLTKVHHLPVMTVGLAMTGFGVGACLGTFIFGAVSDRLGRRKAIVLSQFAGGFLGIIFASIQPGTPLVLCLRVYTRLFLCIVRGRWGELDHDRGVCGFFFGRYCHRARHRCRRTSRWWHLPYHRWEPRRLDGSVFDIVFDRIRSDGLWYSRPVLEGSVLASRR